MHEDTEGVPYFVVRMEAGLHDDKPTCVLRFEFIAAITFLQNENVGNTSEMSDAKYEQVAQSMIERHDMYEKIRTQLVDMFSKESAEVVAQEDKDGE
jgi:hypothetical protein